MAWIATPRSNMALWPQTIPRVATRHRTEGDKPNHCHATDTQHGSSRPGYHHLCLKYHNNLLASPLAFTLILPTIYSPIVAQVSVKKLFISSCSFLHTFNKLFNTLPLQFKNQLPYYDLQSPL